MDKFLTDIRPYVEMLYFISQIGLLMVATYGLSQIYIAKKQLKTAVNQATAGFEQVAIGMQQIQLLKEDMETRNRRQSIEKSLEYIQRFSVEVFGKHAEFIKRLQDANLTLTYSGKKSDFNDILTGNEREDAEQRMEKEPYPFLNEMELFATAMINKVSDEEVAFIPLSKEYCRIIEENYDIICLFRERQIEYSNLIQLYRIWSDRRKKKELDEKIQKIEDEKSALIDVKIKPIGIK